MTYVWFAPHGIGMPPVLELQSPVPTIVADVDVVSTVATTNVAEELTVVSTTMRYSVTGLGTPCGRACTAFRGRSGLPIVNVPPPKPSEMNPVTPVAFGSTGGEAGSVADAL